MTVLLFRCLLEVHLHGSFVNSLKLGGCPCHSYFGEKLTIVYLCCLVYMLHLFFFRGLENELVVEENWFTTIKRFDFWFCCHLSQAKYLTSKFLSSKYTRFIPSQNEQRAY